MPKAHDGREKWVAFYDGEGNHPSLATALTLDAAGYVYVAGATQWSLNGLVDFITIKYDADGMELWASTYNGPGNQSDIPSALAVDSHGNVYVAGDSVGSGIGDDLALVKYGPDGKELWVARYDGPDHRHDSLVAMVVDPLGNACLTGQSESSTERFRVVIRYDSGGKVAWLIRDKKPGYRAALDGEGTLYLFGSSSDPITQSDYVTTKYDPHGNQLWLHRISRPGNDYSAAITVDPSGNVYVTGDSNQLDGTGDNFFTAKYIQLPQPDTRLSSPAPGSNGFFQFLLQGETNRAYSVQSSSNLADWSRAFGWQAHRTGGALRMR